jgi:hypothetical protein
MIRISVSILVFVILVAPLAAQTAIPVPWDYKSIPITIEVTRDVPVKRCGYEDERGALCAQADFLIGKGEFFRMLEIGLEGGCTIEHRQIQYSPDSCPWLSGFSDHEEEIYVVVEVPGNN